jgi:hypothetical protein
MAWAEALFERPASRWSKHKGDRRQLAGKFFRGPRDSFIHDASSQRSYRACWWRAGRYILLTVHAGDPASPGRSPRLRRGVARPLRVDDVSIRETRYPLENEGRFAAGDPSVAPIIPLAVRGLQMCAHETFMDCPHYEQLQYVGDTRLQMLASYVLTRDDRLCRRAARMFDWSRSLHGCVNSSYPAGPQMISTFPPYWVLMVHDLAFWRDAAEDVRDLMIGVRDALEQYQRLRSPDGLLGYLPGWAFVDTVPEWIDTIYGPDTRKGPSAIVNLLYVYALTKAAELEDVLGEKELAARDGRLAKEISRKVVERFWVPERLLFADDVEHSAFSQHAQCLALLATVLPARQPRACFEAMLAATDLAQAQPMYWMFYLFEVFHLFGRGDLVLEKLPIWSGLVEAGFKTPPEMFEPSRSDCHGWGGHILFHFHATLAGIRPAAPGFERVEIAPSPGGLRWIESKLPHPRGFIEARMEFSPDGRDCRAEITLPEGVTGVFRWRGRKEELRGRKQEVGGAATAPRARGATEKTDGD